MIKLLFCMALLGMAPENRPFPRPGFDGDAERAAAAQAERAGDWDAALLHYENAYDSTPTTPEQRDFLRKKFAELRPKVKPNTDRSKAGVWRVRAYAFRTLDFKWTDADGKERHAKHRYRDEEIRVIRRGMAGFADLVWKFTSGNLRIEWTLKVIDKPLTSLEGKHAFWPGPNACMPHITDLKPGEADTIMVFAKTFGDGKTPGTPVPGMMIGGMLPPLRTTRGATYIAFNWGSGNCANEPDGEPMLHEWLHAAHWALERRCGYPEGLMFTSDGGRMEGESGGDPCYRRKPDEKSWLNFYAHLMREHATRRMWRELSLHHDAAK